MALEDGTSSNQKEYAKNWTCKITAPDQRLVNGVRPWYLGYSRYEQRDGNEFTPYFSGEEMFKALAQSIKGAKKSIDIITWGFDPAIPLVRDDRYDKRSSSFSAWYEEDAYGKILLDALANNPELEIRILVWFYPMNHTINQTQNMVGIGNKHWKEKVKLDPTELETGFTPAELEANGLLPLRERWPTGRAYSSKWFHDVLWDQNLPGFNRITVAFRDINDHAIAEEDPRVDKTTGESAALSFPSDHQKTVLIDFEDDENRHGYVMGHNSMTEYWSAFPFVHRDPKSEMDKRPFHDFSMKVRGPLTVDLCKNFCESWLEDMEILLDESMAPRRNGDPKNPPRSTNVKKTFKERLAFVTGREALYEKVANLPVGEARGQIVRTRPDRGLPDKDHKKSLGEKYENQVNTAPRISAPSNPENQEKEIKNAYMQVTRFARNYLLIVNQYCQYEKLVRHIKFWRAKYLEKCKTNDTLYLLMGTCKPESDSQVFRAHQMANELGLGAQFSKADSEMYKWDEKKQGYVLTKDGKKLDAKEKVGMAELDRQKIKPLFFMFYAIPKNMGKVPAQQVYVHAKLMVEDDVFFTLGSANLNIRSMAVDSELNLISDDLDTAQLFRQRLLKTYYGGSESNDFPNHGGVLSNSEWKKIHKELEDRAQTNRHYIDNPGDYLWAKQYYHVSFQGCIASFEDRRSVVGVARRG